jgi:L-threonylcarbamoyladenylate synthase
MKGNPKFVELAHFNSPIALDGCCLSGYHAQRSMSDQKSIEKAASAMAHGGIVAFPTDTVYGLAADATNDDAVSKIYQAKGRSFDKPLIIFVKSLAETENFAVISPLAEKLTKTFLPGPLTLVLNLKPGVLAPRVTGQFDTVGLRIPDNQMALDLIEACPFPLATTSANTSGDPSPKSADEVNVVVDYVLDGGPSKIGLESTVVDASGETPKFYRVGALSEDEILKACGA